MAGLVTATNGLTFMIGPAAGAALYQLSAPAPFLAAAAATAAVWLFLPLHPTFRATAPTTAPLASWGPTGHRPYR